ncbi:MAG: hypothetical protein HY234_02860 [Acidobacteria bacterium]|nr:hypothetical protein [Acidobacteriota bacterium]
MFGEIYATESVPTPVSPANIPGLVHMTAAELDYEMGKGGRFVHFHYCVSLLYVTLLRSSKVYFIRADEGTFGKSIGYTLISLLAGWWGFPWGPICTVKAIWTNASGGDPADPATVSAVRACLP